MRSPAHLLTCAALALPVAAQAATMTLTVGDDDCFGSGLAACGDGALLSDDFFTAPQFGAGPGDPSGTDNFGTLGTLSFLFVLSLGTEVATAATITAKTVGLERTGGIFGDAFQGARFQINGTDIGTFFTLPTNPAPGAAGPSNAVGIASFAVAPALLDTNGTNTLTIIPEEAFEPFGISEEFAVDFSRLTVVAEAPPPMEVIPLPASIWFLGGALTALAGATRRRGWA